MNPNEFIIAKKRKKYRFALFANAENCFEYENISPQAITELVGSLPITIEIGAGTASFAVALARRHTNRFYIATDVKADRLQYGARTALEEGLTNIIFVRVHTDRIAELIPPYSVSEIWLTFSDPFPKKRHIKHRLTHPHFLKLYQQILSADGVLHQKTDNHALFDWSLEQLIAEKWQVRELSYDLHDSSLPDDYKIMTTYEKKFTAEGLPIYFVAATT